MQRFVSDSISGNIHSEQSEKKNRYYNSVSVSDWACFSMSSFHSSSSHHGSSLVFSLHTHIYIWDYSLQAVAEKSAKSVTVFL